MFLGFERKEGKLLGVEKRMGSVCGTFMERLEGGDGEGERGRRRRCDFEGGNGGGVLEVEEKDEEDDDDNDNDDDDDEGDDDEDAVVAEYEEDDELLLGEEETKRFVRPRPGIIPLLSSRFRSLRRSCMEERVSCVACSWSACTVRWYSVSSCSCSNACARSASSDTIFFIRFCRIRWDLSCALVCFVVLSAVCESIVGCVGETGIGGGGRVGTGGGGGKGGAAEGVLSFWERTLSCCCKCAMAEAMVAGSLGCVGVFGAGSEVRSPSPSASPSPSPSPSPSASPSLSASFSS